MLDSYESIDRPRLSSGTISVEAIVADPILFTHGLFVKLPYGTACPRRVRVGIKTSSPARRGSSSVLWPNAGSRI